MFLDFEPGDFVINPKNKNWGIGQIQSIIKDKVTVNFENAGKKVINSNNIILKKVDKIDWIRFETNNRKYSLFVWYQVFYLIYWQ